jgi:hypothetical protein
MQLLQDIKKRLNSLNHSLSAKEEIILDSIDRELQTLFDTTIVNLLQRVTELEKINAIALPKVKFAAQKLGLDNGAGRPKGSKNKVNTSAEEKKEDYQPYDAPLSHKDEQ